MATLSSEETGRIYHEVSDSGPGIAEEQKHQIFDPWCRRRGTGS